MNGLNLLFQQNKTQPKHAWFALVYSNPFALKLYSAVNALGIDIHHWNYLHSNVLYSITIFSINPAVSCEFVLQTAFSNYMCLLMDVAIGTKLCMGLDSTVVFTHWLPPEMAVVHSMSGNG